MNKRTHLFKSLAGLIAAIGCISAAAQTIIPTSFTKPQSAVDTSKPGFTVRVVQANTQSGTLPTSTVRAESQLAGILIDPKTGQPYENTAIPGPLPDGSYEETTVINYEQFGGAAGNDFPTSFDAPMPGIPGSDPENSNDNIAMEIITYLSLKSGTNRFGVNSDDGFRVTVSSGDPRDQFSSIELGVYDGGRGAEDSIFDFVVPADGVYAFRMVYYEGGGGASVEWFSQDLVSGEKTLINDVNVPNSIKAYRTLNAAAKPYVRLAAPVPGSQNVSPGGSLTYLLVDNGSQVASSSIQLSFDSGIVTPVISKSGSVTTITYDPPGLLEQQSTHTVKLVFADNATPPTVRTNEYSFKVANFGNIKLPAPIVLETFEGVEEGLLPNGWVVTNASGDPSGFYDLDDPNSDAFLDWVVISRDHVQSIGDNGRWEAGRRLNTPELYVNGLQVTNLMSGKFLYAESDQRGGTQVQMAFSPDYNLTGKSNIFLSFHSAYEQNQDNIGSVEYSINGGATWEPVLYMVDADDIIKTNGVIDAWATLSTARDDQAKLLDPDTFELVAQPYGAFIGVSSNLWGTLGAYISGRINDDQVESKRVELFRLPKADNQAKVRLRFAQAGTASWYFGVDDVGLYSIETPLPPAITAQPKGVIVSAGSSASLSVTATGTGLTYQWFLNDVAISGATNSSLTIASATAGDAGGYHVRITNEGGFVISSKVNLKVVSGSITDNLVVHLNFENNLTDSSGRGNNGSAVGSPSFAAGIIGTSSVQIPSGSDYVSLGAPADLNFGTATDFSISFWAAASQWDGDPSFIGNKDWNSGSNAGYVLASDNDGRIQWNIAGSPGARKDYDSPGGIWTKGGTNWAHIVVVFDRSGSALTYTNGVLADSRPINATLNNMDTPANFATNIGQDGTGTYGSIFSDLRMDDIGIWRRALSSQEVAAIYAAGVKGKDLSTATVGGGGSTLKLNIASSGNGITLTWTGTATLESADSVTGPWSTVNGAASGMTVTVTTNAKKFYRLKQ